jgi:hypothetical protein
MEVNRRAVYWRRTGMMRQSWKCQKLLIPGTKSWERARRSQAHCKTQGSEQREEREDFTETTGAAGE